MMSDDEESTMWPQRIVHHFEYLLDMVHDLSDVMDYLVSQLIFTFHDTDFVEKGDTDRTDRARNRRFLRLILEKGEKACDYFVEALHARKCPHIIKKLESTDAKYLLNIDVYAFLHSSSTDGSKTTPTGQRTEMQGMSTTELMVTLVLEILANSGDDGKPLYTLEQELCRRLRENTGRRLPNFPSFAGIPFKVFLEQNSNRFSVREINHKNIVVLKKTKKKKKRDKKRHQHSSSPSPSEDVSQKGQLEVTHPTSHEDVALHENEWTTVRSKNPHRSGFSARSKSQCQGISKAESASLSEEDLGAVSERQPDEIKLSIQEAQVKGFLNQLPGDTVIFRSSVKPYAQDRLQFTVDVVSLWNTPNRDKGYIVMGIAASASPPHTLTGLSASNNDSFFQELFQGHLLNQIRPQFSYCEVKYLKKLVGIIQVEVSFGQGFPCMVISDDMAPRMSKNQMWTRRKGSNVVIEPSDLFVGHIHAWFQGKAQEGTVPGRGDSKSADTSKKAPTVIVGAETCSVLDETSFSRPAAQSNVDCLMKALGRFEKGHFVLICGSLSTKCNTLKSLANPPWIAVYDFDFSGRDSGLLSVLEDSIKRKRSLKVNTWLDHCTGLTERGVQWWSMMGRRDISQSRTSKSYQEWFSDVRDKVDKLCVELARFNEDYTVLTFLLLWPSSKLEAQCIHKFLTRVRERMKPKLIICFTDPDMDITQSKVVGMIRYEYEGFVKEFESNLQELCSEIKLLSSNSQCALGTFQYRLPADDKDDEIISDEDAAWLSTDLEVLYLENECSKQKLTAEVLKKEADHFYRGGTIRLYMWYDVGVGLDVERSISKELVTSIKSHYINKYKGGTVNLFHAPGSGGSTLAQRVIWDLHETAPCAKIRQRSGSTPEDIAERLNFLQQRSHLPVVALFDGEDEPRLKQILSCLYRAPVIVLQLQRYLRRLEDPKVSIETTNSINAYLPGFVTKKESRNLVLRLSDRCENDSGKVERLKKLDREVQENEDQHQLFEFGMTVFAHEFKGVRAFVKGYLGLSTNPCQDLQPWQKCLGYISLVYFYGQIPMPCQFFANIMGKSANYVMSLDDFPDQFQVLVVPDYNEGRQGYLRIGHYIIAREILEQILSRVSVARDSRTLSRNELSRGAKQGLSNFCIEFIGQVAKKSKSSITSSTISHILTKTFIFRDNEEFYDVGTNVAHSRKKPQFSQIMMDIDSHPPFNGRLEILQSLCKTFPHDPNLRAHLGRFYTLCRPGEEKEAEDHYKAALNLCYSQSENRNIDEMDERTKQSLMHIYHMFGNTYQRRIVKYTGWSPGDEPSIKTSCTDIEERLQEVIYNADTACEHFLQARLHTTLGKEDCYAYVNDIHVRLQACDFVNRCYPGGLSTFLSSRPVDFEVKFVWTSVTVIEDLIMECYHNMLLDSNAMLQMNVRWYCSLFNNVTTLLKKFITGENLASLQLKISCEKLKFRGADNVVAVENPDIPTKEIDSIVNTLERIFQFDNVSKRMRDTYYKDWILAIRNRNISEVYLSQVYPLRSVLAQVRQWHEAIRSPQSTLYLFVLLSLLGFGTRDKRGSMDYLAEAEMLFEETMQKQSKTVQKARHPWEWLGRESAPGIRRMVATSSVEHAENRCIKNGQSKAKLDVCKGTILPRNKKLAGHINLDLGENSTSIKVFYIPLLADMEGTRFEGTRVQFHLAFTLDKGYEAYEVKPLKKSACLLCGNTVELTWIEPEVVCSCGEVIFNRCLTAGSSSSSHHHQQ